MTYLILGVFTAAFIALFVWLNQVTANLAVEAVRGQMLAVVETAVCFINDGDIDGFETMLNTYKAQDESVYNDPQYQLLRGLLFAVKNANANIKTNFDLFIFSPASDASQVNLIVSTVDEFGFMETLNSVDDTGLETRGMGETVSQLVPTTDYKGESWITACSPIISRSGKSLGTLCADFNAQLLTDVQRDVRATLTIAFIAIYPFMIFMVFVVTRRSQKARMQAAGVA